MEGNKPRRINFIHPFSCFTLSLLILGKFRYNLHVIFIYKLTKNKNETNNSYNVYIRMYVM